MAICMQTVAYAITSITFFFGTATTFLRFYTRLFILRTWGADDWVAIIIMIVNVGQQVILYKFLENGVGLHMDILRSDQITQIFTWLLVEEVFYYFVHFVIKFAFLLFYLRLSHSKRFRLFVHVGMVTNTAIFISNTFLAFFQCTPFDEIIHRGTHPDAVCIPQLILLLVPSLLNISQDIYILVLPIGTVWKLHMTLRRKIAVLSVIGFGASAVLVAAIRLVPIMELYHSTDTSFALGKMVIVAAFEVQLAIVAVNLPAIKALWTKITGGSSADSQKGSKSYSNHKGYKLSSMSSKFRKNKSSRAGSITRMERGLSITDSEEELFKIVGTTPLGLTGIKITTDVDVQARDRVDHDPIHELHKASP